MNGGVTRDMLLRLMVLLAMFHDTKTVDDAEDVVGMTRGEIEKDIITPENEKLFEKYKVENPSQFTLIQNKYKDFNKREILIEMGRIENKIKSDKSAQRSSIRSSQQRLSVSNRSRRTISSRSR
jgi:hypothetical protein